MTRPIPQSIDVGTGAARRRIAFLLAKASKPPGLVWLQGFKSDMVSTKATALAEWAGARGHPLLRFDYSGHGQSEGRFEDGTIGRWLEEARTVFERLTDGPQIVIGSSMGGYLALLLLRHLLEREPGQAARIKALLLIAPAWNMTEDLMWAGMPAEARTAIERDGVWLRPSLYGDPYPITRGLIEDGRTHLIPRTPWDPGRPVTIIHGRIDPDVPFRHSQVMMSLLPATRARLIEVPDGEHRLSRPEDLEIMFSEIERLTELGSGLGEGGSG